MGGGRTVSRTSTPSREPRQALGGPARSFSSAASPDRQPRPRHRRHPGFSRIRRRSPPCSHFLHLDLEVGTLLVLASPVSWPLGPLPASHLGWQPFGWGRAFGVAVPTPSAAGDAATARSATSACAYGAGSPGLSAPAPHGYRPLLSSSCESEALPLPALRVPPRRPDDIDARRQAHGAQVEASGNAAGRAAGLKCRWSCRRRPRLGGVRWPQGRARSSSPKVRHQHPNIGQSGQRAHSPPLVVVVIDLGSDSRTPASAAVALSSHESMRRHGHGTRNHGRLHPAKPV